MIGSKRDGSKASPLVGFVTGLLRKVGVASIALKLGASRHAPGEVNWNALKAARELQAIRQRPDIEKYRALLRRT